MGNCSITDRSPLFRHAHPKSPRRNSFFVGAMVAFFVAFAACALFPLSVDAASVAKIKGRITDKKSKQPIVGASVSVEGTDLGAITNDDGFYEITQVPAPETYVLRITGVGLSDVIVKDLQLYSGQTLEQNVGMETQIEQLNEVIEVIGNRDIINKFEVSNTSKIQKAEIERKPVSTVDDLLKTVSGVTTTNNGEILIRGGRAGEVAFIVDGVNIRDPVGGNSEGAGNISIVSGALQEIQVIKDGNEPEYGQSLSGVVKITSQTGSPTKTAVMARFITDDFGNKSLNKYSTNLDDATFTVSGPDPFIRTKLLPALGINYFKKKELTYFLYGQVIKDDGSYNPFKYTEGLNNRSYDYTSFLGVRIPERLNNTYSWNSNIKFKPQSSLSFILSYQYTQDRFQRFDWIYRYSPGTAVMNHQSRNLLSLQMQHNISKDFNYEMILSYRSNDVEFGPSDPAHPGLIKRPDQFLLQDFWEDVTIDRDGDGKYTPPEPLVNIVPDTVRYGDGLAGPGYTFGEVGAGYTDIQSGKRIGNGANSLEPVGDFVFNGTSGLDSLEGEFFADLNGNGVWDRGDDFRDTNGNGIYDDSRRNPIETDDAEPYSDGDISLGEPFTDVNRNGVYDEGIDRFVIEYGPGNQDLNFNSRHDGTGPLEWTPQLPYIDVNGNGVFDTPNQQYDPGELFVDLNKNGKYDGKDQFLDPGSYTEGTAGGTTRWHHHTYTTYGAEIKSTRKLGTHEIRAGGSFNIDNFTNGDIRRPYLRYTGRPDVFITDPITGNLIPDPATFPDRGSSRDFFTYKPYQGSFYFRDRMEYGQMIALLGFRWDYFVQSTGLLEIALNDDIPGGQVIKGDRHKFSPRIGFSYPISDKAKVFFNYGHYYQFPLFGYLYARNTNSAEQDDVIGNFNIDYEKTVQYSFGVRYKMSEYYALHMAGYYKDNFDLVAQGELKIAAIRRSQYQNRDYGRARGFEMSIERRGGLVNGEINYNYAFNFGKSSQVTSDYLTELEFGRQSLTEKPLNDDIRHSVKMGLQLVVPGDKKANLFGIPIINDWQVSVEGAFETGRPYTPDRNFPNLRIEQGGEPDENSLRMPSRLFFDVRFEKPFKVAGMSYRGILWVENVFDNKFVRSVYNNSGLWNTSQVTSGQRFGSSLFDPNPLNLDSGREVRLGIQMNI